MLGTAGVMTHFAASVKPDTTRAVGYLQSLAVILHLQVAQSIKPAPDRWTNLWIEEIFYKAHLPVQSPAQFLALGQHPVSLGQRSKNTMKIQTGPVWIAGPASALPAMSPIPRGDMLHPTFLVTILYLRGKQIRKHLAPGSKLDFRKHAL